MCLQSNLGEIQRQKPNNYVGGDLHTGLRPFPGSLKEDLEKPTQIMMARHHCHLHVLAETLRLQAKTELGSC